MRSALERLLDINLSPAGPLGRLANGFEEFFAPLASSWHSTARVNVRNDEREAVVQMELAGVDPSTIDIQLKDRALTVTGKREAENLPEGSRYVVRERPMGGFERTLLMPWAVNPDGVKASSRNGVLTVRLPRAESDKPRQIQIKTE